MAAHMNSERLPLPSIIQCFLLLLTVTTPIHAAEKLNVLLIISDDLRDSVHCYGNTAVQTPNLDRLAARGVRFEHAYVQYPVCNPSRTSFLTGLRCEQTGVVDNKTLFRSRLPDVVTFPQLLRQAGWHTAAFGKVFHVGEVMGEIRDGWMDVGKSWDEGQMFQPTPAGRVIEGRNLTGGKLKWCQWGATAGTDDDQPDGQTARHSIDTIEKLTKSGQPWMVAAGFHRPHDPFLSPKKYFDLYTFGSLKIYQRPGKRHAAPATFAAGWCLCGRIQRVHGSRSPGIPAGLLCRRVVHGRAGWPVDRHIGSIESLGPHARHFHRRSRISPQRAQLVEQKHAIRTQLPRAVHRGRARREKRASLQLNRRTGGPIPHHRRLLRRPRAAPTRWPKLPTTAGEPRTERAKKPRLLWSPADKTTTANPCAPSAGGTPSGATATLSFTMNSTTRKKFTTYPTTPQWRL